MEIILPIWQASRPSTAQGSRYSLQHFPHSALPELSFIFPFLLQLPSAFSLIIADYTIISQVVYVSQDLSFAEAITPLNNHEMRAHDSSYDF